MKKRNIFILALCFIFVFSFFLSADDQKKDEDKNMVKLEIVSSDCLINFQLNEVGKLNESSSKDKINKSDHLFYNSDFETYKLSLEDLPYGGIIIVFEEEKITSMYFNSDFGEKILFSESDIKNIEFIYKKEKKIANFKIKSNLSIKPNDDIEIIINSGSYLKIKWK